MFKLIKTDNIQHNIDSDIEYSYDCDANNCDDICRCRTIDSVSIEDTISNRFSFFETIWKFSSGSITLEDIFAQRYVSNLFSPESFEATWSSNYYGEELDSIKLIESSSDYDMFNSALSLKEKFKLFITKEYGFVLDVLDKIEEWELVQVDKNDVLPSTIKVNKKRVEEYSKFIDSKSYSIKSKKDLEFLKYYAPIVLMDKSSKKYKIYDGNHRFSSLPNKIKYCITKTGKDTTRRKIKNKNEYKEKTTTKTVYETKYFDIDKVWVIRPKI